ncbi:hypothetical protein [Rouxiella sp. WC2420]|uniref:Uncharacterized protein n=1 Tax=Rouxiella sp. WC2420 TaxID=3234145 RepID=A0AB39VM51_9GAMM
MKELEERIAELEQKNEDYGFRMITLEIALRQLSIVTDTLAGKDFSISGLFESSFGEMIRENPENLDVTMLEDVKQAVCKLLGSA